MWLIQARQRFLEMVLDDTFHQGLCLLVGFAVWLQSTDRKYAYG